MRRRLPIGTLRVLRHRDYAVVALGNFLSQLGTWSQFIGIGWAASRLTDRPILITIAFGSQFFPNLFLSPMGGVLADRYDRRTITILGNIGMAIPSACIGLLFQRGSLTMAWLITLALVGGVVQALSTPSTSALIPVLVPVEDVQPAVAFNGVLGNVSRFLGASLAGWIIVQWGTATAFYVNSVSFFAVVVAWLVVRPTIPRVVAATDSFMARLAGGARYARGNATVRNILIVTAATHVFVLQQPLLPLIAKKVLHGGPSTYGHLQSATGLGALCGALLAGQVNSDTRRRLVMVVGLATTAASVFGIALSRWEPLSLALQAMYGFGFFMMITISLTVVTLVTPDHFRGRVLALNQIATAGMVPVMSLVAGAMADLVGIRNALLGAGCAQVACVLWFVVSGGLASVGLHGHEEVVEPVALPDDVGDLGDTNLIVRSGDEASRPGGVEEGPGPGGRDEEPVQGDELGVAARRDARDLDRLA